MAALILGMQAVVKSCGTAIPHAVDNQDTIGEAMKKSLALEAGDMLYGQFMPGVAFLEEGRHRTHWLLWREIDGLIPFYGYLMKNMDGSQKEGAEDFRTILLAEAQEGDSLEGEEDMPDTDGDTLSQEAQAQEESLSELLRAENEAAIKSRQTPSFIPHGKQVQLDLASLENYETLVQQFYTVDANTVAGSDQLDIHKFLDEKMTVSKEGDGPQILIYHTHSQEGFLDSVPGDSSTTIMGVGEQLATILTEDYGYRVLHHLGQYDIESRNDSYSVALTDLEEILRQYPSIQVVIDLHRDEMPEGTHLAMELDGRPTARFMFFNGLSRTKKTGNIAYLYNENLDGNLAFSFQMQKVAMEYYPGLTRKIYLKGYRYNLHLRPKSLLVELGAQNNTLEEAMNACGPLAHILHLVLSGQV